MSSMNLNEKCFGEQPKYLLSKKIKSFKRADVFMRIQRQIQDSIMKKESGVELDEHIKKMK